MALVTYAHCGVVGLQPLGYLIELPFPLWVGGIPTPGGYLFYHFGTTLRLQMGICDQGHMDAVL